ncbi:MAG: M50 family metallopeptidase [Alphaproteobacteria bacterium]|nr:M50 family metallopeptidase [Alphaproteobacteria bacterium]
MFKKIFICVLFLTSTNCLFHVFKTNDYFEKINYFSIKYIGFYVGVLAGLIINLTNIFNLKNRYNWLQVFIHELYHALGALLCGGHIEELLVNTNSGHVKHAGSKNADFVTLCPYILPCIPIFIFVFYFIIKTNVIPYWQFLFAFSFSQYLLRAIQDAKPFQPDVKSIGYIGFYAIFVCANLFWIFAFIFLK